MAPPVGKTNTDTPKYQSLPELSGLQRPWERNRELPEKVDSGCCYVAWCCWHTGTTLGGTCSQISTLTITEPFDQFSQGEAVKQPTLRLSNADLASSNIHCNRHSVQLHHRHRQERRCSSSSAGDVASHLQPTDSRKSWIRILHTLYINYHIVIYGDISLCCVCVLGLQTVVILRAYISD